MAKPKLNQSQRRKLQKSKAAAAALTGLPAAPTTGPRDGAVHRVVLPAARGQQSGMRKQVEMVVKHYHFYQQVVAGGSVIPPNIMGGQDMSVPPPVTVLSEPWVVQSHPRVVQSHPEVLTPKTGHSSNKGSKDRTVVRVRLGKPVLTLWGSSHLAENHLLGPDLDVSLRAHFQQVINLSVGGAKLTNEITEKIEIAMRSHPGPNQVYVILFNGNNMRKTTKPALEVAKIVSRFRRIMIEAQKAKVRVLLCGTIPDPRPAVDSKLKLLDEALKDLEMGQGNNFLGMRAMMLDVQGHVRKDLYKPNGDIHLNAAGTKIVSLRIQRMLEIMLPTLVQGPAPVPVRAPPAPVLVPAKTQRVRIQAPVQAPVPAPVVNAPLVVNVQQVAAVVNAPVVVQHVAVVEQDQVETPMEEDEDSILQQLFFKKYGRALPEKEKEKDDVEINLVIDLTDETEEMEVAAPVVVVKTEPIEAAEEAEINSNPNKPTASNVAADRKERREVAKARKAITAFGKTLRKMAQIKEKEAPEIVANSDMSADKSVNTIELVNPIKTAKEINAKMEAEQEAFVAEFGNIELDEFHDDSEFRLYTADKDIDVTDDEEMIHDV
jgi:hypothetical protein